MSNAVVIGFDSAGSLMRVRNRLGTDLTAAEPLSAGEITAIRATLAATATEVTLGVIRATDAAYGATGDGSTDDTQALEAAVAAAAAGATKVVLLPAGTYVTDSFTVPAGVTLWMLHGAMLEINPGETVTLEGGLEAGLWQVFGGSGAVAFGGDKPEVLPQWFGAKGDGVTDSTGPFQKIADLGLDLTINIPRGTYILNLVNFSTNIRLVGAGDATVLTRTSVGNIFRNVIAGKRTTVENLVVDGATLKATGVVVNNGEAFFRRVVVKRCGVPGFAAGNTGTHNGLSLAFMTRAVVDNCEFIDNERDGLFGFDCDDLTVTNSLASGNGRGGFVNDKDTAGSSHCKYHGNTATDNGAIGIHVESTSGRICTVEIIGNTVEDCGGDDWGFSFGIASGNYTKGTISGNTVINQGQGEVTAGFGTGIDAYSVGGALSVTGNVIINPRGYGIHVNNISSGFPANIHGNTIKTPGLAGIFVYQAPRSLVSSNVVEGAQQEGIYLNLCSNSKISTNIVRDCSAAGANGASGIRIVTCLNATITGNDSNGANHLYGVQTDNVSTRLELSGNLIYSFGTAWFSDAGGTAAGEISGGKRIFAGNAVPTSGSFNAGDEIRYSTFPGGCRGAVCTASGTPGTWREYGGNLEVGRVSKGGLWTNTADYQVDGDTGVDLGLAGATIAGTLTLRDYTPGSQIVLFASHYPGNSRLLLLISVDGNFVLQFFDAAGVATNHSMTPGVLLRNGETYHFSVTIDRGGLATLRLNGDYSVTRDISASAAVDIGNGSTPPWGALNGLDGVMHDLFVYNRVLTGAEAMALAETGVVDISDQWGSVAVINSGTFEIGKRYRIASRTDGDFTTVGAADNNVGTEFTATGTGAGILDAGDTVVKIGCVLCLDLQRADPDLANSIQDLAGNYTATMDEVVQVRKAPPQHLTGTATLVAGTVTVNTAAVTASSRILLTINTPGGTVGAPYVSARVAGTSFTITSTSGADTSEVAWLLVEG